MVRLKPAVEVELFRHNNQSQFHYGSIKTHNNSVLLLKDGRKSQFHYGSIKTHNNSVLLLKDGRKSQFHYGSIKTPFENSMSGYNRLVSIPLWFD